MVHDRERVDETAQPISGTDILEAIPYMAMILSGNHEVVLANTDYSGKTGCLPGDRPCYAAVHELGVAHADCPLRESASQLNAVEHVIQDARFGRLLVSVYPLERVDDGGRRLFLHLARPIPSE